MNDFGRLGEGDFLAQVRAKQASHKQIAGLADRLVLVLLRILDVGDRRPLDRAKILGGHPASENVSFTLDDGRSTPVGVRIAPEKRLTAGPLFVRLLLPPTRPVGLLPAGEILGSRRQILSRIVRVVADRGAIFSGQPRLSLGRGLGGRLQGATRIRRAGGKRMLRPRE